MRTNTLILVALATVAYLYWRGSKTLGIGGAADRRVDAASAYDGGWKLPPSE